MRTYEQAELVAKQIDEKLIATDFKGDTWVYILHEEGTQLLFRSAFLRKFKNHVIVFTEHHKTHVYAIADLQLYLQLKSENIAKCENTGYNDQCFECNKTFPVESLTYYKSCEYDPDILPRCDECLAETDICYKCGKTIKVEACKYVDINDEITAICNECKNT